jgi:hypothetical protein
MSEVYVMQKEATMARPQQGDEPMDERLIFPVTKSMAEEIKDYWHDRRLNSRAEAIRELLERGLAQWRKGKKA